MSELRQAAQAVVDRWDTPAWKDAPHTAEFIDRLRVALAESPMSERERFEAIVSSSPYEKSIRRWPDDATKHAWPGSYRDLDVDFAWLVLQDFLARSGQAASGSSQGARSDEQNGVGVWQPEAPTAAPLDMVLHCPACGLQHIDAPEPAVRTALDPNGVLGWPNPPHRSHLCHGCGHIWRPADVPTNGVAAIKTKGKADSPIAHPPARSGAGREEGQG